jgi:hypothetical protein
MGRWLFEELRGGPRRTPQEAELFKDKDANEGEYPGNDYLVREVIQNSLDARADDNKGAVRVRFSLHEPSDAPGEQRLAYYFSRLRAPLKSFQVAFTPHGFPNLPRRYLVCEDFGTRGLEGDERYFGGDSRGDTSREDFYWFWRNIGSSAKTGDDLGRWGLGKTVYRAVSRTRCMLGLTVRASDGRSLLMGQAVLQPHSCEGHEYHPEGYWCADDGNDFPAAIADPNEIEMFRTEWRLTRREEPGLSVVSPFVPDELDAKRIVQAVLINYFVRILRGELVVEVSGPTLERVVLDKGTIDEACDKVEWGREKRKKLHAAPPLNFARQCLATVPTVTTQLLGSERAPQFDDCALDAETLSTVQRNFSLGKLVAVCVRIALPRKRGKNEEGEINVYVQQQPDQARCTSYYVREGMTITKRSSRAELRGVQALVFVESGPMSKLLGDTEGPAHEDWNKSAERPDREWKSWKNRVDFARTIVDRLVEYLTPKKTEPDVELLADYFWLEDPHGPQPNRQRGNKEEGAGSLPNLPEGQKKWFRIVQREGGFAVRRDNEAPLPCKPALLVTAAYDIPRGNPLKHWSPLDFVFSKGGNLRVHRTGVNAVLKKENEVRLEIVEESFEFSLDGFDRNRDLYVCVKDLSDEDSNETMAQ